MLAILGAFFVFVPALATLFTNFTAVQTSIKVTVCGNNIVESDEQCDGTALNGASCSSLGLPGNTLSCRASCEFNTTYCVSGGGGGGGGGGNVSVTPPAETAVNFKGRAYPNSKVALLKDAQLVAETTAGPDASFEINITGLSGGTFLFSLYGEDSRGRRSSLLTFPISITSGATTKVSGIFIAPTLAVDKSELRRGDTLSIFGQSAPAGDIVITINSETENFVKTTADQAGAYLLNFDTAILELGEHFVKAKASVAGEISGYSKALNFLLNNTGVTKSATEEGKSVGDYNEDGGVNLVDFSIAAYWYKRTDPPTFIDLNKDGKVDLIDFSILAYHWTG